MDTLLRICCFSLLVMAFSCRQDDGAPVRFFEFDEYSFRRQSPSCAQDSMRCIRVAVTLPVLSAEAEAAERINDSLVASVARGLTVLSDRAVTNREKLSEVADSLIVEYRQFLEEHEAYDIPWEVQTEGEVLFQNGRIVSFEVSNYSYTGGAHPNTYIRLLSFDTDEGAPLNWGGIIRDSTRLLDLAEDFFRRERDIGPEVDLRSRGFFQDQPFQLPENYAPVERGVYFFYNPYEVAPYAAGPTEFIIPYESLRGVLDLSKIRP